MATKTSKKKLAAEAAEATPATAAAPAEAAAAPAAAPTPAAGQPDGKDMFFRQRGLVDMNRLTDFPITVIGAGGIGSAVIAALAQMGARNITVYDDDALEMHNISNQIYPAHFVGKKKVVAAKDYIKFMYDFDIKVVDGKYDGKDGSKIVISGVDSMTSREAIWGLVQKQAECLLYIDARMGGMNFEIYNESMLKLDHVQYERTLVPDKDALDLPCTARSIGFNVFVIGGYVASQVRNFLARQKMPPMVAFDMAVNEFRKANDN